MRGVFIFFETGVVCMIQFDLIAMRHTASGEHEFKYLVTGITDFTDETDLLKKIKRAFMESPYYPFARGVDYGDHRVRVEQYVGTNRKTIIYTFYYDSSD